MALKQDVRIQKFYRSDKWKIARAIKIASVCGVCELCGAPGVEVHHKIHLTHDNVIDPDVSINQDNLMLLCTECHNKIHNRFTNRKDYKFNENGDLVSK